LETIRESARQKLLGSFRQVAQEPNFISLLNDGLMDRFLRDLILQDLAETVNKADFCQYAPAIYEVSFPSGETVFRTQYACFRRLQSSSCKEPMVLNSTYSCRLIRVAVKRWKN
jgi:hypothetical protein